MYVNDFGIVLESVGKLIGFHVNYVVFHLFHKKIDRYHRILCIS